MRTFRLLSFLLFLFLPSSLLAWQGKVIHITDGDTVVVLKGNSQVDVRLYGIDCPEKGQPYGHRAKEFTSDMAALKNVEVKIKDIDRYERTVALVYIEGDGECLNEELIKAGYTWVYEKLKIQYFSTNVRHRFSFNVEFSGRLCRSTEMTGSAKLA